MRFSENRCTGHLSSPLPTFALQLPSRALFFHFLLVMQTCELMCSQRDASRVQTTMYVHSCFLSLLVHRIACARIHRDETSPLLDACLVNVGDHCIEPAVVFAYIRPPNSTTFDYIFLSSPSLLYFFHGYFLPFHLSTRVPQVPFRFIEPAMYLNIRHIYNYKKNNFEHPRRLWMWGRFSKYRNVPLF